MYRPRLRRRNTNLLSEDRLSPGKNQQHLSVSSQKPVGVRLPSISPKYKHPASDKEQTLERLELESIFKRLDISPSTTHRRSPLVRKHDNDIVSAELKVPCTTTIPGEQEAAEFVTALITRQPSPYKKTGLGGPVMLDLKAEQILKEMEEALKGRESPSLKIVQMNEQPSLKNEAQRFWRDYVCEGKSIRWDQFEENLLLFLDRTMIVSLGNIRKVDWCRFFLILYDILSYEDSDDPEWPLLPDTSWQRVGKTRKVLETDWVNFVTAGSLNHTILMAMDRERSHFFSEVYQNASPKKVYRYGSGDTYQGQWKLSKRHGQGIFHLHSTQESFSGQMSQGVREGYGVMQGSDCQYKGDWKQDVRHGYGVLQLRGTVFRGMFRNNSVRNGTCVWSDGRSYEGEWENAGFAGRGKYADGQGGVMVGEWKEGKLHGNAVKTMQNGDVYRGEWIAGVLEGEGEIDLEDTRYVGSVVDGKEHGKGEKEWKRTGVRYQGEWESGQMQGEGCLTNAGGDVYQGNFQLGDIAHGRVRFRDGREYTGQLQCLQMHGSGVLTYPPSSHCCEYRGNFEDNMRAGDGIARFDDGGEYCGRWEGDEMQGKGVLRTKEFTYEGRFANGTFEGYGELHRPDGTWYKGSFSHGRFHGIGESCDIRGVTKKAFFESGDLIGYL